MAKERAHKSLIVLLAVMMFITSIMTCSYAPKKRNHLCCGSKCATCLNIKAATELSNAVVVAPSSGLFDIQHNLESIQKTAGLLSVHETLVSLKVLILS